MLFKNRPVNQYQPWEQRLPVMYFKGYRGDFREGGTAEQESKIIVMKALKESGLQESWSLFVAYRHREMISLCQTIVMSVHAVRWKRVKWNLKQEYTSWFPHLSLWDTCRWKLCLQSPQVVWHGESPPGHVRPCDMDRELVQVPFGKCVLQQEPQQHHPHLLPWDPAPQLLWLAQQEGADKLQPGEGDQWDEKEPGLCCNCVG